MDLKDGWTHQDVEAAEFVAEPGGEGGDGGRIGDVEAAEPDGAEAPRAERRRGRLPARPSRAVSTTASPCSASRAASACPIPRFAPVTTATVSPVHHALRACPPRAKTFLDLISARAAIIKFKSYNMGIDLLGLTREEASPPWSSTSPSMAERCLALGSGSGGERARGTGSGGRRARVYIRGRQGHPGGLDFRRGGSGEARGGCFEIRAGANVG